MAIVKKLKQHPPLPPSRYEVGIYCRVSTASKTQVVSVGHQLSGLIADVANSYQARLYDVYLDVQSGRTSDNRKNLMRLLDDCRAGRVTLVYTKSISRFARNTVDVLTIVRELDEYYGAAEPPVRSGESHLSGLTEPPIDSYSA